MFLGNLVHTSSVLMRRDRQRQVGPFNADLIKSGEDYEFHLRTCRAGAVAYADVASIRYRIGAVDQLTAPEHMIWLARNNLKTVLAAMEPGVPLALPRKTVRRWLAEAYAWVGAEELFNDRICARHHFRASLSLDWKQHRTLLRHADSYLPLSILRAGRRLKRRAAPRVSSVASR